MSSKTTSSSSATLVATSMFAGAAIAGAAFHVASRGKALNSSSSQMLLSSYQTMLREVEHSLRQNIQQDVAKEVKHGLERTTSHFQSSFQSQELVIQKSLLPMATARSVMDGIHRDVGKLKNIFHAPQSRGNVGEFLLESLVKDAMPVGLYDFQYTLSNHKRVDCILHLEAPIGKLPIDSKFPLDSFRDDSGAANKSSVDKALFKHINDIATKYIIAGETADFAVLFLPSASVYLQIVEHHADIMNLALQKRVYMACPMTLMPLLAVLHRGARGVELQEQTHDVINYHKKQTEDIERLLKWFDEVTKANEKTAEMLEKMRISIRKIQRRKKDWEPVTQFTQQDDRLAKKLEGRLLRTNEDRTLSTTADDLTDGTCSDPSAPVGGKDVMEDSNDIPINIVSQQKLRLNGES